MSSPRVRRPEASDAAKPASLRRLPIHVLLIIGAFIMVFPFFWQAMTAFKTYAASVLDPPIIFPDPWTIDAFVRVFKTIPFAAMFANSVVMTVGRTVGQVVLCTMAGYAFARIPFPGRGALFVLFLSVLMVPSQLFLIPQYEIMQTLGWVNTMQALIAPGIFSAFGTFLMRQFFLSLPVDFEEAARIDGANQWQIFWLVMVPLARPGVITVIVFTLLYSWNDFLWPLVITTTADKMTLPVGLSQLVSVHSVDYTILMAGSLLATIPMLVTFMLLQRQFIQGIASSGLKG